LIGDTHRFNALPIVSTALELFDSFFDTCFHRRDKLKRVMFMPPANPVGTQCRKEIAGNELLLTLGLGIFA
jgi:hypothetical protein